MKQVFFAPTKSNHLFVSHISGKKEFAGCRFTPLHEDPAERLWQLATLARSRDNVAYLWGDGFSHHESYYLSMGSGAKFKMNIDSHSDLGVSAWLCQPSVPDYTNHMRFTRSDGIDVHVSHGSPIPVGKAFLSNGAAMLGGYGNHESALTVDCDAIISFPAAGGWIAKQGLEAREIADFVSVQRGKFRRFDMGGLLEGIAEFMFRPGMKKPEFSIVRGFAAAWERSMPVDPFVRDEVFSYAFDTYADILRAYLG